MELSLPTSGLVVTKSKKKVGVDTGEWLWLRCLIRNQVVQTHLDSNTIEPFFQEIEPHIDIMQTKR
jgi:hypothetical protein